MYKAGDIVHLGNYPLEHRKTKYAVILDNNFKWCFFINTENRKHYICYAIYKFNHKFLNNETHYISCNKPTEYEEEKITHKECELNIKELEELMNHINNNVKTINLSNKQIICKNLLNRINQLI